MHVAIIGNGIAGITAALRIRERQPDWRISVVSGESTYAYSRPALMYIFMGHMRYQDTKPFEDHVWVDNHIELVRAWVSKVDVETKQLELVGKGTLEFDKLLIATGSKSNKFGWPGQDLDGVQGLYDLRDLRLLYENCKGAKRAAIVGGGLIGIELGEMLHSRGIHVDFVVRESSYWDNVLPAEESAMINHAIRQAGMGLFLETNLKEIVDDGKGRACAIETDKAGRIECQIVGLTAGVSPNIDLLADTPIETGRGVLVDQGLRTNVADVFAAGDCAEIVTPGEDRNLLQQVWYTGKEQGRVVGDVISGLDAMHEPGVWYNSAKFLDLEYQTYGDVGRRIPGEENLFWGDEEKQHGLRLVHKDGILIGVNLMGIRYRHRVCESWIRERRSIGWVIDNLSEANFDPEFFHRFEPEIARAFQEQLA